MTDRSEKKPAVSGPKADSDAEKVKDMQAITPGQSPEPPHDGSGDTFVESLARWDELDSSELATLAETASSRRALQLLQQAEAWMHDQRVTGDPCPDPDELYNYGRGPGYSPVSVDRRDTLSDHVQACAECREAVQVLRDSPPLPLHWTAEEPPAPGPAGPFAAFDRDDVPGLTPSHPNWVRPLIPLAGAAAVLLFVFIGSRDAGSPWSWNGWGTSAASSPIASGPAIYRGEFDAQLRFPRGRLLAPTKGRQTLASTPVFELAPQDGASTYRIVLLQHNGSAFATVDGSQEVLSIESARSQLTCTESLAVGHYT
ncbi:MAG: hypothetical protein ACI841_002317, partial [Planctomycetota bacterium]